jgi:glycosyltransferase involved in cell wall biosynthesis
VSAGELGHPASPPLPFVSIVMPIRNERAHIVACVESVLAGDYPVDRLELLAIDGMSDDGTRDLLAELAGRHPQLRLVDNPKRLQAPALNRGIELAQGEIIVRLDAHAIYPPDYVGRCVARLLESGADNVGGVIVAVPGAETPMASAIALALSHPFGVGNAQFRIGTAGAAWVDTVHLGCWRRDVLRRLGGFATDLPHAEDDELNTRLRQQGGRILLDPEIRTRYVARPRLRQLALMLHQYGYSKPFAARQRGRITTVRQVVPALFLLTLALDAIVGVEWHMVWLADLAIVALHLAVGVAVALRQLPWHGPAVALRLPLVFATMHAAYGWGYLRGVTDLALRGRARAPARLSR